MEALLQPVAHERVTGTRNEQGDSNGDEGYIEHNALPFESVNVFTGV